VRYSLDESCAQRSGMRRMPSYCWRASLELALGMSSWICQSCREVVVARTASTSVAFSDEAELAPVNQPNYLLFYLLSNSLQV
jgi:hypothetical protein